MILPRRSFERVPPGREARSVYIFGEGSRREFDYFNYFKELDSRIKIEVYKLHPHEDNSPLGLLKIAEKCIIASDENPNPKYDFIEGDEVWIVLDIDKDRADSRKPQIAQVKLKCDERSAAWNLTRSNPCFEVWLYYHKHAEKPEQLSEVSGEWKQLVDSSFGGGFDARKHPLFIQKASENAEKNFQLMGDIPDLGCTEVYKLANSILPLIKNKLSNFIGQV